MSNFQTEHTSLPSIQDVHIQPGQPILIRSSLNISEGSYERIIQSARTINLCTQKGARVTVIGHRSAGDMADISKALARYVPHTYIPYITEKEAQHAREQLENGEVLLLQNLRNDPRETCNDPYFAKELIHNATLFVYDGFDVSHREHASTSAIFSATPHICFGMCFVDEVRNLSTLFTKTHPSLAIVGGAKIQTKLPLLKKLLNEYDIVAVGGVLANTLLQAKGEGVGDSVTEEIAEDISGVLAHPSLMLPNRILVHTPTGEEYREQIHVTQGESIRDVFLDKTIASALHTRDTASTQFNQVMWNGPLGDSTNGYTKGSATLAQFLATQQGVIVGGGDVLTTIPEDVQKKYAFVSTGGGSMVHYLTHHTVPVLEAYAKAF